MKACDIRETPKSEIWYSQLRGLSEDLVSPPNSGVEGELVLQKAQSSQQGHASHPSFDRTVRREDKVKMRIARWISVQFGTHLNRTLYHIHKPIPKTNRTALGDCVLQPGLGG